MSFRAATVWSLIYLAVALMFGVALGLSGGWDLGTQFLAGYVVERSLSVDNVFVFVIIMGTFAVPRESQSRVLGIGIALALVLRAIFIIAGSVLLSAFSFMFLVFGIGLIATAVHLFRHRDEDPSVSENAVVALARRRLRLGPLAIAFVAIATTDFLFALDSIPVVYGVTTNVYLVLAANAFALLGMRPLFFLVAGLLDRLVYLSTGLAAILAFIGVKLVLHYAHLHHPPVPEISTGAPLAAIVAVLGVTTLASLAPVRAKLRRRAVRTWALALAVIAAGGGVVALLGGVPDLEHALRGTSSTLGAYTYALVGVMAFLETGAGIGLIAPGELAVVLGGVAAGQGEIELVPLIALVWACAVAGDALSFALGRRLGRGFLLEHGHRVRLTPGRIERVERYFARHGGKTIVVGRFIGAVRALAPFIAGASGMPARRFVPATIAAAGLWAVACSVLGYVFWNSLDHAVAVARNGSLVIGAMAVLAIVAAYAVKRLRRRRIAADPGR